MAESIAIVTGASSGIGKATALRLARDFTGVAIVARAGEPLAAVAEGIRSLGSAPLVLELDLMRLTAGDTIVQRTIERFGRIDAVLNIAGAVPGIDVFQMTDAEWHTGMELKFHGARRLTIAAWPALKASGGAVVFTSGTAAVIPKPAAAAIGAINAGIEALAKAFAERGLEDGIQVNSISPGAIMTGRRLGMLEKAAAAKGLSIEQARSAFLTQAGIARFGEAHDIAEAMAFAVSPAARWMTGTVLRVDGGEVKTV